MCGIAGLLALNGAASPEESALRQMLGMIRHRGPDQFGIYLDDGIGLGSARLSIIDVQGGQQPIANEDETLWIVFNGEIFNFVELRDELKTRGHSFSTRSDTEVLLHLYEAYGVDCLERLNGQFAMAIWDRRRRELFLARDHFGVRPLFYTRSAQHFVFASEMKAILAERGIAPSIDPLTLHQIFTLWGPPTPRTIFRDIVELPPGHYLRVSDTVRPPRRYWSLRFAPEQEGIGTRNGSLDYIGELSRRLVEATKLRLRADVPVGAYLSGGLDSSAIASIVRHETTARLETFSVAFSDPRFDEHAAQIRMASFLGTEHHVVRVTHAEIGEAFPDVIWHTETPLMRTAPVPMYLLSKRVREHGYKVVLTGEGADELLGGYDIFKEALIRQFWSRQPSSRWRPLLLRRLYADIPSLAGTPGSILTAFFSEALGDTCHPAYSHLVRWRNNRRTTRFFSPDVVEAAAGRAGDLAEISYPEDFLQWGILERAQFVEVSLFFSQYLLSSQGDRVAMAHGVEGRFPFLDTQVVDLCRRLPSRLKIRGLTEKYALRRAVAKWLPEEVTRRPKRPYRAPIHESFFHAGNPDYVREVLSTPAIRAAGLFRAEPVSRLVRRVETGAGLGETDDMALAGILSAQLVYHQFVAHFRREAPLAGTDPVKVCRRGTQAAVPSPGQLV